MRAGKARQVQKMFESTQMDIHANMRLDTNLDLGLDIETYSMMCKAFRRGEEKNMSHHERTGLENGSTRRCRCNPPRVGSIRTC